MFRIETTARLVLAALLITLGACSRDPERARQSFVRRGDAYFAKRQYAEASIEYRKALQQDGRSAEAYIKLAEAYVASGDVRNALPAFVRGADLAPENTDANLKAGNLMLLARQFQDAKTRARAVLVREPDNVRALILLGNALAGLQDLDNAVRVTERAARLAPDRAGFQTNVGVLELARGNAAQAEAAFRKAAAADRRSPKPLLALAGFYQSEGRSGDAEAALKEALGRDPRDIRGNQMLAALYLDTGRAREAEPYLKTVAGVTQSPEAALSLADFYISTGRLPEALALLQKVSATKEGYAVGRIRTAMIAYASGRRDEAHATLREVLKREPKNASAMAMEARLLLGENRSDEALALVKEALTIDARSAQALVTLGRVQLARNAPEEARQAFVEALNNDPARVDAQIELARIHRARREIDTSIAYADKGVRTEPDNLEARLTLVRSLAVRPDDAPRAEQELKALLSRHPGSSDVHALLGIVGLTRNDYGAARRAFERALALDPSNVEALSGLAAVDAGTGQLPAAVARVERQVAASAKPPAELLLLAAKVHAAARDAAGTERRLKQLVELYPSNPEGYTMLGQYYVTRRQLGDARREFGELVKRQPRSVAAHTMIGLLAQAQGDVQRAQEAYEKAVQIDASAGAAANNLAWLYATSGGNLEVALQLAQGARSRLPGSAEVADTLGYVYYKKEMSAFAIPLLQQAAEQQPSNPRFHFHLGLAYAQAGDDAKARAALEQALKLDPRFAGADEARRVMATLVY